MMTTEVVTVEPWTPFRDIVTQLAEHRISAAPIPDPEGNVLGLVTEADLLLKQEHPDLELPISKGTENRADDRGPVGSRAAAQALFASAE